MKKLIKFLFIFSIFFSFALYANAATFKAGDEYYLPSDETVEDNLYSAGANIVIDGIIKGDIFAAGSNITINNTIEKDANIAGSNLLINGDILDDLRGAGANINLSGKVSGEVTLAGGNIIISQASEIGKDVYVAGGHILVAGNLNQNLYATADSIEIKGIVNGNITIDNAQEIIIYDNAQINGNISYKSEQAAKVYPGAQINGEVNFEKIENNKYEKSKKIFKPFAFFYKLLSNLLFAVILFLIFKKTFNRMAKYTEEKFAMELLRGFLVLVSVPVAIIIVSVTIIGIPLAIVAGLAYSLLLIFSFMGAGILLGSIIYKYVFNCKKFEVTTKSIILGIVIFHIIRLIPYIGGLICFILGLAVLGTLSYYFYRGILKIKKG